jgi:hypothetical protein
LTRAPFPKDTFVAGSRGFETSCLIHPIAEKGDLLGN